MLAALVLALVGYAIQGQAVGGGGQAQTKPDAEAIQGTWQVTASFSNGKPAPDQNSRRVILTADYVDFASTSTTSETTGFYRIDAAAQPSAFEFRERNPAAKEVRLGLYELSGDQLTLMWCAVGVARPNRLDTRTPNCDVAVMKRVVSTNLRHADGRALLGRWHVVAAYSEGRRAPIQGGLRFVFTPDFMTFGPPDAREFDSYVLEYFIDPTTQPKSFEHRHELDRGKPIIQRGIYELSGDDLTLMWCAAGTGGPARIDTSLRSCDVFVLKRGAARPGPDAATVIGLPTPARAGSSSAPPGRDRQPGDRIGPYQLVRVLEGLSPPAFSRLSWNRLARRALLRRRRRS